MQDELFYTSNALPRARARTGRGLRDWADLGRWRPRLVVRLARRLLATWWRGALPCGLLLVGLAGAAQADDADLGRLEFKNSCAACHGLDGKGGTDMAEFLRLTPPDLTLLQRQNGGVFPTARVYNTIDGRLEVRGHGSRAMPVWGQRYSEEAAYLHSDPLLGERSVRVRILALIDYLYQLQR